MPRVQFTANLARQTEAPPCQIEATTVAEALAEVFRRHPLLRSYVLDDQGALRKHMAVFVDGNCIADRSGLSDAVRPDSDVLVMQSLSGG